MVIYIFIYLISSLLSLKYYFDKKTLKSLYLLLFIFIGIVSGSRVVTLGGYDTGVYELMYTATNADFTDVFNSDNFLLITTEKGYIFLMTVFKILGVHFNYFLLILGICCGIGLFIAINNFTKNTILVLTIFLSKGYLYFFFTAQRQVIALIVCWLSIYFVLKRRLIPFIALVFLASSFHISALFFIVVYFLPNIRIPNKNVIILFICSIILAAINIGSMLGIFFSKYLPTEQGEKLTGYIENVSKGVNVLNFFELVPMFFVFLMIRESLEDKNKFFNLFFNLFLLFFFITIVFYDFQIIARLKSYLVIGYIFLIAALINGIKDKSRGIGIILFFLLLFFFVYIRNLLTFDNGEGYLPYQSFLFI